MKNERSTVSQESRFIGAAVRALRGKREQRDLAAAMGVNPAYLCKLELGRIEWSYPLTVSAARALGVPVRTLHMAVEGEPPELTAA